VRTPRTDHQLMALSSPLSGRLTTDVLLGSETMRLSAILSAGAMTTLAACACVHEPSATRANALAAAVGSTPAPPPPTEASAYIAEAGRGDLYEIKSSQVELERGQDERVQDFAQRMIGDHTQTTQTLLAAAAAAGLPASPPASLDARRQALLDQLRALPADDVDRIYLRQQALAHEEALALHQNFAARGDAPALRPVAAKIAGVVRHHMKLLRSLRRD
jgi:putative membrane protein